MPRPEQTEDQKRAKIMATIERYFDTDITDADSAYDVLLDNGCDPTLSAQICADMFADGNPFA